MGSAQWSRKPRFDEIGPDLVYLLLLFFVVFVYNKLAEISYQHTKTNVMFVIF